jgi:hypothetical protein
LPDFRKKSKKIEKNRARIGRAADRSQPTAKVAVSFHFTTHTPREMKPREMK